MAARFEIVIDCNDVERTTDFWCAALAYERRGEAANYRSIVDPEGLEPKVILQGVADAKVGKNRVHLDIQASDIEAEAAHLEALGATRVTAEPIDEHGVAWIVMQDPDGNEFCVCQV
jgi:predicted enzyme related to lactoylglutathione lyase